jgi:hypothetical protein
MKEVELPFRFDDPEEQLAESCDSLKLSCKSMGTLKAFPGCKHWHLALPPHRGILECTWWPDGKRFWLKVARNRDADWIEGMIPRLSALLKPKG